MTHTYHITGMTCMGCQFKIQNVLQSVAGVTAVNVDLENHTADVTMDKHVDVNEFQAALSPYPKYAITEDSMHSQASSVSDVSTVDQPFYITYKPVLLIFGYVGLVSVLAGMYSGTFDWMLAMRTFMGGFFLTFSFFKMLDLGAFADSYQSYDIIARKFRGWGYVYAFIELGLGLAYAINLQPVAVNIVTLIVMALSIIGVLQSVLNKRAIRCACLGTVFNLPMSTITIIEDGLMILMSAVMLVSMLG